MDNLYETSDIYLAATLLALDFPLVSTNNVDPERVVFAC